MKNVDKQKSCDLGSALWEAITSQPLGTLTKREMELLMIQSAIGSGLVKGEVHSVATAFRIAMRKAHSYMEELALRQEIIRDAKAIQLLTDILTRCEVNADSKYFVFPVHDASLRIWLERKLSEHNLLPGETLRRDLVKLTPQGLLRMLGPVEGIRTPYEALDVFPQQFHDQPWYLQAKKEWKPDTPWTETAFQLANGSLIQNLHVFIPFILAKIS